MEENDVLTNKSAAALLRDSELNVVATGLRPVDLRTIPLEQWDNHIGRDVTLPAIIKDWLTQRPSVPIDECFVHQAEDFTASFYHGVKPPYYIWMSITLQQTGRPWAYVPEAGAFMTGMVLGKDE